VKWNCPHCQTELATPALNEAGSAVAGPSPGWAYAKCSKCSGFAMVERRSGKSVKIAKKAQMSEKAASPVQPPVVATPAANTPVAAAPKAPSFPPPFIPTADPRKIIETQPADPEPEIPTSFGDLEIIRSLPPVSPRARKISPWVSGALIASVSIGISLTAGNYLFSQVKTQSAAALAKSQSARLASARNTFGTQTTPAPLAASQPVAVTDQNWAAQVAKLTADTPAAPAASAAAAPATKPRAPVTRLASNEVLDSIHSTAMAPIRRDARSLSQTPVQLFVQARTGIRALEMRTGPGAENPILGLADLRAQYPVIEWKDRWFKIEIDEKAKKTAWVHYNGIELLSDE
jgi:hypothetical protein